MGVMLWPKCCSCVFCAVTARREMGVALLVRSVGRAVWFVCQEVVLAGCVRGGPPRGGLRGLGVSCVWIPLASWGGLP